MRQHSSKSHTVNVHYHTTSTTNSKTQNSLKKLQSHTVTGTGTKRTLSLRGHSRPLHTSNATKPTKIACNKWRRHTTV